MRSLALYQRFSQDFPDAIVDDFEMLYALARRRSKVSSSRFRYMYQQLGAPFQLAPDHLAKLFDDSLIESVFRVREWAFDYRLLKRYLRERLHAAGINPRCNMTVERIRPLAQGAELFLADGTRISAGTVFNVTYAGLNEILVPSGLAPLPLKHEFVELALIEPPDDLRGLAVTVIDGPFFSLMPYPAEGLYSLTHVRYTPHWSWMDGDGAPPVVKCDLPQQSRWRHMKQDAQRYLPCLQAMKWRKSLFDIKTVPIKSELNDGRPILLHRHADAPHVLSILSSKIDNIYDLFTTLPALVPRLYSADTRWLLARK